MNTVKTVKKIPHYNQSAWDDFRAGYNVRFAALLYQFMLKERATCDSPEYFHVVKLDDNQYKFQAYGPSYGAEAVLMASLPSHPIEDYMNRVHSLEHALLAYDDMEEKLNARARMKKAAMEKMSGVLTPDEMRIVLDQDY